MDLCAGGHRPRRHQHQPRAADEAFEKPKPKLQTRFRSGPIRNAQVYRMRLDAKAKGFQVRRTPTGFSVLVPGRKALESGKAIARRDKRIASVVTKQTPQGARITFRFKRGVPHYQVLARKDSLKFYVNPPKKKKRR